MPAFAEQILQNHLVRGEVRKGKPFMIKVDKIGSHEVTLPRDLTFNKEAMKRIAKNLLENKYKIILIHDHDLKRNPQSALNHWYLKKFNEKLREAIQELGKEIKVKEIPEKNKEEIYVDNDYKFCYCKFGSGICHRRILEDALVKPGETLIFPDSHTCTAGALGAYAVGVGTTDVRYGFLYGIYWDIYYGSDLIKLKGSLAEGVTTKDVVLKIIDSYKGNAKNKVWELDVKEFEGVELRELATITNMSVESNASTGIILPNEKQRRFLKERGVESEIEFEPNEKDYEEVKEINVNEIEPLVAFPHSPANVKTVKEAEKKEIKLDQAFIGSCTLEDSDKLWETIGKLVQGQEFKVTTIVIPSYKERYEDLMFGKHKWVGEALVEAGALIMPPHCGPCLAYGVGNLADGEKAISTSNRNFVGRMGSKNSEVYLANALTTVVSALEGKIVDPREYL